MLRVPPHEPSNMECAPGVLGLGEQCLQGLEAPAAPAAPSSRASCRPASGLPLARGGWLWQQRKHCGSLRSDSVLNPQS